MYSYCTCGWHDLDDENDTNFEEHIEENEHANHKMCSFSEWNLHRQIIQMNANIHNLEMQLEDNCVEKIVLLEEKIIRLENENKLLKEKLSIENLYLDTNEHSEQSNATWGSSITNSFSESAESSRIRTNEPRKTILSKRRNGK
jgi:beta-glucosidase-like glycosyl hydrolase